MKVGVLALQGAFREHRIMLEHCGVEAVEIRKPDELDDVAGLIIPGGESTTIGKMLIDWGLMEKIKSRAADGMAIYGTCAGMIVLARDIIASDQPRLGLMNIKVRRNASGRQRESFEADLNVPEFGPEPVRAVFIRAPYIEEVGPEVNVLASVDKYAVVARQEKLLATSFHPELTRDDRIHKYFIAMISGEV
ncbi:MAG: pyridoxal 5'-phosphate synthase glutaminase subunit PdxT [Negativicutes bacterium]|nr:pyridoxal 5'-phosphate synthase glutaminase subunit PdxT [Negativicutes bacterium]